MTALKPLQTEIIERADSLYAKRSEIENVRLSVDLLRDNSSSNYDAAWRLGRAYFFLGQEATSESEARAFYVQGINACMGAAKMQPARVEGQFWLGVNLALLAGLREQLRSLIYALRANKALVRAVRIDSTYHAAGPLRVLGRLQHKLPKWLGGGHERARTSIERAVKLAPTNTVTRVYFAELLLEVGDEVGAREQYEAILRTPSDPAWEFETKRDKRLAQATLPSACEAGERIEPGA